MDWLAQGLRKGKFRCPQHKTKMRLFKFCVEEKKRKYLPFVIYFLLPIGDPWPS